MGLLRLLLAVTVVCCHTWSNGSAAFVGGELAVETFFQISGFYMALILAEKYVGPGAVRLFWRNRFLRLYPAYWVVLALTVGYCAVDWVLHRHAGPLAAFRGSAGAQAGLYAALANLLIVGQDAALFLKVGPSGHLVPTAHFLQSSPPVYRFMLIPPAWSLSLEICFYLLAPWLVRRGTSLLLLVMAGAFALRVWIYGGLHWADDPWVYRFFPTELLFFVAGILAYRA